MSPWTDVPFLSAVYSATVYSLGWFVAIALTFLVLGINSPTFNGAAGESVALTSSYRRQLRSSLANAESLPGIQSPRVSARAQRGAEQGPGLRNPRSGEKAEDRG